MKNWRAISRVAFINSKVTATISISLVLFLLGLIITLALLTNKLSSYVKESFSFDIVLSDEIKDTEVNYIIKKLKTSNFIKSVEYISKETAAKQVEADIGQDPQEFLAFNPLPGLIVIHLHSEFTHPEKFPEIENQIKRLSPNISSMTYRKELITLVNDNVHKISILLLGLATLLLIISVALINNTIRLTVYSKRFLIHTMKLVGATPGFIRGPLIRSQIFAGIIAAIIAIGLLFWGIFYLAKDIGYVGDIIDQKSLFIIAVSVFILGIFISLTATYFAVNRYLRMEGDDLFYI